MSDGIPFTILIGVVSFFGTAAIVLCTRILTALAYADQGARVTRARAFGYLDAFIARDRRMSPRQKAALVSAHTIPLITVMVGTGLLGFELLPRERTSLHLYCFAASYLGTFAWSLWIAQNIRRTLSAPETVSPISAVARWTGAALLLVSCFSVVGARLLPLRAMARAHLTDTLPPESRR